MNTKPTSTLAAVDQPRLVRLWRAKRKKHLRPLAEMPLWQAITYIETRTITGLQAMRAAMDSATSTNCWWAEMEACRHFRPLVQEQLRRKLDRKNRKANAEHIRPDSTPNDHE
jgi:hypothetical protein